MARALLAFYRDAGVDALLGEEPVDRTADASAAAPSPESGTSPAVARAASEGEPVGDQVRDPAADRPLRVEDARERASGRAAPPLSVQGKTTPLPPPDVAAMAAREAATGAATLDELRALLESFKGCALHATATQLVFADGNPQARVMFVGEAPGYEEDRSGKPFVGRSGKLLDLMMQAIGLDRSTAYIANVVPWRPPGNRTPTPQETAICLPFIRRQVALADPDILVCLGQPATHTLLDTKEGITRTRGRWLTYDTGSRQIRALATFHPAYLLRNPLQKRFAWRDFLAIKKALVVQV
ncbi:MAG: uracil-DNA glycosylase [Xanthobacteraceae bacterium]